MTVLNTMYAAVSNSPRTYLDGAIGDTDDTINLVDATVLPAAPNICTLGIGEAAETIYYGTINGNILGGVVRGYDNTTAAAWSDGSPVARYYTSGEHNTFISNINKIDQQLNPAQSLVISKDNNDIERKFWKDDFSVDSSDNYLAGEPIVDTVERTLARNTHLSHDSFVVNNGGSVIEYTIGAFETAQYFNYQGIVFYDDDGVTYAGAILFCFCSKSSAQRGMFVLSRDQPLSTYSSSFTYKSGTLNYTNSQSETNVRVTISSGQVTAYWSTWNVTQNPSYSGAVADQFLGKRFKIYSYRQSPIGATGYDAFPPLHNYISVTPSESYSDDFTTDTTERYQAVTGTVAYDTDHMNVTTASGANGKASGRLKSYKFCEGSQIYDVLLPTGADGDFICLATHSSNGLMTDGIGVGLQSDGAGNWNLATLSGTTVTEGADSGLDDADVARIEIEKDNKGCYWYYIYDASGVKPTTPTGKLFTTKSEGYTGWYANGAGATTQTYAIDNISIRAESIVGRTNVEVTEPFWFRDDFGEDSLDRYNVCLSHVYANVSVVDGNLQMGTTVNALSRSASVYLNDLENITVYGKLAKGNSATSYAGIYAYADYDELYLFYPRDNTPFIKWHDGSSIRAGIKGDITTVYATNFIASYVQGDFVEFKIIASDALWQFYINGDSGWVKLRDDIVPTAIVGHSAGVSFGCYNNPTISDPVAYCDSLQIFGTRVYNKPIHRGAMFETYHDGSEEVLGTCWFDDFEADTNADYTIGSSAAINTTNKYLELKGSNATYPNIIQPCDGYYGFVVKRSTGDTDVLNLKIANQSITITGAGVITIGGTAYTGTAISSLIPIEFVASGSQIEVYSNGVLIGTKTGLTLAASNVEMSRTTANIYVYGITVVTSDSINYPYISSVTHGARYDVEEYVESQLPLTNIVASEIRGISAAQSTLATDDSLNIVIRNLTDDTELATTEIVSMDGTLKDTKITFDTGLTDIDDTISIKQTTADDVQPDGIIYLPITKLKPTMMIQRGELP